MCRPHLGALPLEGQNIAHQKSTSQKSSWIFSGMFNWISSGMFLRIFTCQWYVSKDCHLPNGLPVAFVQLSSFQWSADPPQEHFMYIYIYIYVYTHIYIHIHTHTYIYLSLSLSLYIYIYIYISLSPIGGRPRLPRARFMPGKGQTGSALIIFKYYILV